MLGLNLWWGKGLAFVSETAFNLEHGAWSMEHGARSMERGFQTSWYVNLSGADNRIYIDSCSRRLVLICDKLGDL